MHRWNEQTITDEIRRLHAEGVDLSYSTIARGHLALMRACVRHFGSWRAAVEHAGFGYRDVRRYRVWTRETIVARIRELHDAGEDLSWRHISTVVDPQLAAAAAKPKHFGSWRAAIEAAGLTYSSVRRYRTWTEQAIIARIRDLHDQGIDLNAKNVEDVDITLITAARRKMGTWDRALTAAGLDFRQIVLRRPFRRKPRTCAKSCPDAAADAAPGRDGAAVSVDAQPLVPTAPVPQPAA